MGQTATKVPPSGIGRLQLADLWKGFIKATGGIFLALIVKSLNDKALPTYDQMVPFLEAGIYFFASYLGINAATNNVGEIFQKDKDVVVVGKKSLDDLEQKADAAQN